MKRSRRRMRPGVNARHPPFRYYSTDPILSAKYALVNARHMLVARQNVVARQRLSYVTSFRRIGAQSSLSSTTARKQVESSDVLPELPRFRAKL